MAISRDVALPLAMIGLFVFVTLGAGGIKSNVVVLGADQFKLPEQAKQQESFFNFFYWCINIGATVAFLFLTNVALYGLEIGGDVWVPERFGFFASFAIPTTAFVIALILFVAGKRWYVMRPPEGSAVIGFLQTISRASMRELCAQGGMLLAACILLSTSFIILVASFFVSDSDTHSGLAISGLGMIFVGMVLLIGAGTDGGKWVLSPASSNPSLEQRVGETDAAAVVRVLPVAACVIVFWMIYIQMSTTFLLQGLQMDLKIGDTELSPATLNVFDSLAIMILIPIVDRGLYPCLERLGLPLGMLQKIGIGFGFAAASVAVAGIVEIERKHAAMLPLGANATATCGGDGGKPLPMSELSIWWQTPQYVLIGFGEIFAAITCYELFYATVPAHMRSVCQSINLLCTAFGSLAAGGLTSACAAWLPNNLNQGHLEYLYFTLAGIMAVNIAIFAVVGPRFAAQLAQQEQVAPEPPPFEPLLSVRDSVGPGVRMSYSGLDRLSGQRRSGSALSERHKTGDLASSGGLAEPLVTPVADSEAGGSSDKV